MEIASLTTLALPFLLGAGLVRVAAPSRSEDRIAFTAWAWIFGSIAVGVILHLWLLLELPLRGPGPVIAVAAVAAATWTALVLRQRKAVHHEPATGTRTGRIGTAVILLAVLALPVDRTLLALKSPVLEGDEAHIWSARAKALWQAEGFNDRFRNDATPLGTVAPAFIQHPEYPPLNPLLQLWSFVNAGRIQHRAHRLPIQASAIAALLLLFALLRRALHPLAAGGLVLLVASTEVFDLGCRYAMSDVMLGLGFLATLAAWQEWRTSGDASAWRRGCVALSYCLFTKREAYALVVAIVLSGIAFALKNRGTPSPRPPGRKREIAWLLVPAAAFATTLLMNRRFGFQTDLLAGSPDAGSGLGGLLSMLRSRLEPIGGYLIEDFLFSPEKTRLLPFAFALIVSAAALAPGSRAVLAPAIVVILVFAADVFVLATHPAEIRWELEVAGSRVLGQLLPAMAWCTGLALAGAARNCRGTASPAESPGKCRGTVRGDSPATGR